MNHFGNVQPAIENLTNNQMQADMDGCMVTVSRQALDEVLTAIKALTASPGEQEPVAAAGWDRAAEIVRLIDDLRSGEGDSVTILCDNPDFNGQPNCAVICNADWTDWQDRRFAADTILDALSMATTEKRLPLARPVIAESNGHHWVQRFNLTCCRDCGIVRRADDSNSLCKGVVGVSLRREAPAPEGVAKIGPQFDISQSEPEMIWDSDDRPDAGGGVREAFVSVLASLAAAISLLERMPKAKKAAPSDTMFAIMLDDYRKALETGRAALSTPPAAAESNASVEARLREESHLDACREKLSALRERERQKMNAASDRAEGAASTGDMAEVSISSTESERHRQAFSALNAAIAEFDKLYEALSAVGDEATKSEGGAKITHAEIIEMFGEVMPVEAVTILQSDITPNEARKRLREITPSSPTAERREIVVRWPAGCIDPNSCERNRYCMYVGCEHHGTDIKAGILAALDGGAGE